MIWKKKFFLEWKKKKRRKTIKNYFDKKSSVQLHSSQIKTAAAAESKESKQHSNSPNEPLLLLVEKVRSQSKCLFITIMKKNS